MRLVARNETPQPLFEDIARQLFSQLVPNQEVATTLREKVAVEGESLQDLLREWVTVLLDGVRVQRMVFGQFRITVFKMPQKGPYTLQAEVLGEHLDPQTHLLHPDTPRIGCQEVQVRLEGKVYLAEVVLNNEL